MVIVIVVHDILEQERWDPSQRMEYASAGRGSIQPEERKVTLFFFHLFSHFWSFRKMEEKIMKKYFCVRVVICLLSEVLAT